MDLLHRYWPFIASIAASDASKEAKLMNAYPFEFPVSGSLIILGVWRMTPKAEKVSYSSFSSTSGSKFPMNMLAPTSRFFWWADALFTRIGFPNSFIMFIILIA